AGGSRARASSCNSRTRPPSPTFHRTESSNQRHRRPSPLALLDQTIGGLRQSAPLNRQQKSMLDRYSSFKQRSSSPRKSRLQNGRAIDGSSSVRQTAETLSDKFLRHARSAARMDTRAVDAPSPGAARESDTASRARSSGRARSATDLSYKDLQFVRTIRGSVPLQKVFPHTSRQLDPSCRQRRQDHA